MEIFTFDEIDNRFVFQYNKEEDYYFVFDRESNIKNKLPIRIAKRDDLEYIRYYYPKPNNIKSEYYHKAIYQIRFQLFGEFERGSGSQLKLTDDVCKKIIKKSYDDLGFLLGYTDMIQSEEPLLKKVYSYISNNGGVSKHIEITKELGLNYENYYTDHNGVFLKSSFEFIFFSILHFNKIEYEYEAFKINRYVPDFYIPKNETLIEILGISGREYYSNKSIKKEELYTSKGYNYKPIEVDKHNPKESIFTSCEDIFGKLKSPDYKYYYKKYILTSDEFLKQLKSYLIEINEGRLKVSVRIDKSGFKEKYRKYYEYVMNNYGSIQMGVKELIGIPSAKFKSFKTKNYWKNIDFVREELENVFKKEKRIPSKYECRIKFRKQYTIWNVYRFWGEESLKEGGEFYKFIEELKLKYGYLDIDLENKIKKEKKKIEFLNEVQRVVMLVYDGSLPINGKVSLIKKYRAIYHYLFINFKGVFYYIKEKIGYPPPHILRPKGYYQIEENVKYELTENWKKFKRILGDSERFKKRNDNTYFNMVHIIGIKELRKGGKYFNFIETLKVKYGYDDRIERAENELEENMLIYLKGINDGKWNTKKISSKKLGIHSKYLGLVRKKYGNIFLGIKELIGFPNPNVLRYHKYYEDIENCKYEIEENIKRLGYLPTLNDSKKPPLLGNNSISGVYAKYGVKEFRKGGIFYETITRALRNL